jgi:four helix bundle protein
MPVLEKLIVWQLADSLRAEVAMLTRRSALSGMPVFREQIRDAAGAVVSHIAEGYGRSSAKDFARFLDIAAGSLRETKEWLADGVGRGAWTADDIAPALNLCVRLNPALRNLRAYLRRKR